MARIVKKDEGRYEAGWLGSTPLHLEDVAAEAKRMILFAQRKADHILSDAAEQSEESRLVRAQSGYEDGFARGRDEGLAEGARQGLAEAREAFAAQAADLLDLLGKVTADLSLARDELFDRGRRESLDLAIQLAEKVVGQVAIRSIGAARVNLKKVLDLTHRSGDVVLRVNPDQLTALSEYCPEATEALGIVGKVEVVADPAVSRGGVRLSTRHGQIDGTIETQLQNVVLALLGPREMTCRGELLPGAHEIGDDIV